MKNDQLLYLSIVITCFNEERKIKKDIVEAYRFTKKYRLNTEIIVTDDNSGDNTVNIVKELQKKYSSLILIENKTRHGKGFGLKQGVLVARGKFVLTADAGYCVPYKYSLIGINLIKNGADLAIGSRAMRESKIKIRQVWYRQLGSRLFWLLLKLYIGLPKSIKDTQCGFKIYKNEVVKNIFKDLFTIGFMCDIEILLKANKIEYKIGQFPVIWKNDVDSRFKVVSGSWRVIRELVEIKRNLRGFSGNNK